MGLQSHASEAGLQCIKLPAASKCTCGAGFGGGAEAAAKCRRWCGSGFGRSLAPTLITIICWTIVFNEPVFIIIIMPFDHSREVLDIADRESHHAMGRLRSPPKNHNVSQSFNASSWLLQVISNDPLFSPVTIAIIIVFSVTIIPPYHQPS